MDKKERIAEVLYHQSLSGIADDGRHIYNWNEITEERRNHFRGDAKQIISIFHQHIPEVRAVKEILIEELVLCGITHENAPPNKDCLDDCDVLKGWDGEPLGGHCKTKHKKCMDCWTEYIDALVVQICQVKELNEIE